MERNAMSDTLTTLDIFAQVSDNMKNVFDMTSRIDERVKIIMEKQIDADKRFLVLIDHFNNLSARVTILESRDEEKIKQLIEDSRNKIVQLEKHVEILQLHNARRGETWKSIAGNAIQVVTALSTAYLLYKAGLPTP